MRLPLWLGMTILFLLPILATQTIRGLTAPLRETRSTGSQAVVKGHGARESNGSSAVAGQPQRLSPAVREPRGLSPQFAGAGMEPAAGAHSDRSTRRPSSAGTSGLVQSLDGLDGALKRYKVVEGLLGNDPPPPPEGGLVGSLRNLDRVLKEHGVVEKLLPQERSAPPAGGLMGSLKKLGRVVDEKVLPVLKKLPAAP